MKLLPIPPLNETLDRYLQWVAPHLDADQLSETTRAVESFRVGEGVKLQNALEKFAQTKPDSSWLIDAWRESYLAGRAPLPIGSNVSLELIFESLEKVEDPLDRVAHFIVAEAMVHAEYLAGTYHESISPRGDQLCFEQFKILKGGVRIPEQSLDRYQFNESEERSREIAIIWNNCTYLLPILNEAGEIYSIASIRQALEEIINQSAKAQLPYFHTITYAGSDEARAILDQLLTKGENQAAFERINNALFGITLLNETHDYLQSAYEATFGEHFWCYQPLSYLFNLSTGQIQHHVEHTYEDAGMLVEIHQRAQQKLESDAIKNEGVDAQLSAERIDWNHTDESKKRLIQASERYHAQSSQFRQKLIDIPFNPATEYIRFSRDAAIQFSLQYAQKKALGNIQNVYEAVDMREFQSGRTECVRPVSTQSVQLIDALLNEVSVDEAKNYFTAAEGEHRERIKVCKAGHGVNRHLMGLEMMAAQLNIETSFFKDVGYQQITRDFLSTTTLGDNGVVRDVGFVPSIDEGYAIYYQSYRNGGGGVRFLLTYSKEREEEAERFSVALREGVEKIFSLAEV